MVRTKKLAAPSAIRMSPGAIRATQNCSELLKAIVKLLLSESRGNSLPAERGDVVPGKSVGEAAGVSRNADATRSMGMRNRVKTIA